MKTRVAIALTALSLGACAPLVETSDKSNAKAPETLRVSIDARPFVVTHFDPVRPGYNATKRENRQR